MGNSQQNFQQIFDSIFNEQDQNTILQRSDEFLKNKFLSDQKIAWDTVVSAGSIRILLESYHLKIEVFLRHIIDILYNTEARHFSLKKCDKQYHYNILRMLTKIIPVMHEFQFLNQSKKFFWQPPEAQQKAGDDQNFCYGIKLISALNNLLITTNFTVTYQNVAWHTIKATEGYVNDVFEFYQARVLVLQCLVSLYGQQLYFENYAQNFFNPWVHFTVSPFNKKIQLIVQSLLAQCLQYKESILLAAKDKLKQDLAFYSAQVLMIMIEQNRKIEDSLQLGENSFEFKQICNFYQYQQLVNNETERKQQIDGSFKENVLANEARKVFEELRYVSGFQENDKDLDFCIQLFFTNLKAQLDYQNSLIPKHFSKLYFNEEILGIFCKLVELNREFLEQICEKENFTQQIFQIVMHNFCQSLYEETHPQQLFFICLSLLTFLSQNKNFNQKLNAQIDFNFNLKNFPLVSGSYADFLIQNISTAILQAFQNQTNVYPYNLMNIIYNISPFLKNIQPATCNHLMLLMKLFTNYDFLLLSNLNPHCLIKCVQAINNIVSFQFDSNNNLILEMYRKKNLFNRAMNLTFKVDQIKELMENSFKSQTEQQQLDEEEKLNQNKQYKTVQNKNQQQLQFTTKLDNLIQNWKEFNWGQLRQQIPIFNIITIVKNLTAYITKNNILEISAEVIKKITVERSFLGMLKLNPQIFVDYLGPQFLDTIFTSFCWKCVLKKNINQPVFEMDKILYFNMQNAYQQQFNINQFQKQQLEVLQQSIQVEPPSRILQAEDVDPQNVELEEKKF